MKKSITYFCLLIVVIPLSIFLKGIVMSVLWRWFLVPWLTPTAPGLVLCLGISAMFSLFARMPIHQKKITTKGSLKVDLGFDIDGLSVDSKTKEQIKALRKVADQNLSIRLMDTIIHCMGEPLGILAIGWVLKHFL